MTSHGLINSLLFALAGMLAPGVAHAQLQCPLRNCDSLIQFVGAVLNNVVIPVGAVVCVVCIIYSGFLFVVAQGNPEKLKKARQSFMWTCVGTAILLGSWAIALAIDATIKNIANV